MKIISILLLIACLWSCKKYAAVDDLTFVPEKGLKIKGLNLQHNNTICIGSYKMKNDSVVSQFKIQSKYSLIVMKLKNGSSNFTFNTYENSNYSTPGYFSIVDEGLYEVKLSPKVFDNKDKINTIDFFSDKKIVYQKNTDSIKSFSVNFNKFAIKINNDSNKIIYGNIEYYGLKNLDAQLVFYKKQEETFIFIMTPANEKTIMEKDFLYNYLFQ